MSTPCDSLPAFADGDLPPEEAQAFGKHLADCERCQVELTRLLQLEQFGRRYLERHGPVKVPWHVVPRNRWLAVGGVMASAVIALLLLLPGHPEKVAATEEPTLWAQQQRTLEARITYPAADKYRPLSQTLMGSSATQATSNRPQIILGELEKREDLPQLVAAYLAIGVPDLPSARGRLDRMLAKQNDNVDVLCDIGVTHYEAAKSLEASAATGELREALALFNKVLHAKPTHVQALWNRALVYQRLGLPLLAIEDLKAVESNEPSEGWRGEAADRKEALASGLKQKMDLWKNADEAGRELIKQGAQAQNQAIKYVDVPLMRRDFYHAVRSRTSAEAVRALLPLAMKLDDKAGGNVLATYVNSVAQRDFSRRAPLASQYALMIAGEIPRSKEESLLKSFLASDENDIILGALAISMARFPQYSDEFLKRAHESQDPWFQVQALQVEASREEEQEHYDNARNLLESALDLCKRQQLKYRCIDVENDLAQVYDVLFRVNDAERHARAGLAWARPAQWDQERVLLQTLGNVARTATDTTLGRAYFNEALLMSDGDWLSLRNIHQNLAHLAIWDLDLAEARAELDRAMALGKPLTTHGIEALVDIARTYPSTPPSRDTSALEQTLASEPGKTLGQRAYVEFLRGRYLVKDDSIRGRALLEEAIHEAEAADKESIIAQHARAYSYTSLIFDDADRGEFGSALQRFGNELGFDVPARCVLGLTEDTERSLLVVRGSEGQLLKIYDSKRGKRFDPSSMRGVVTPEMVAALKPCALVDALVRPPLQGRAGLLPPEIAWRYRTRSSLPQPPKGPSVHLVVNDVRYDEKRNDKALKWRAPPPAPGEDVRTLRDLDATPSQVLRELPQATEIDMATHGKSDPNSKMAYLLLAPDMNGEDELYEDAIKRLQLTKAPLVILAACEAARGNAALHQRGSLPDAFIKAGARTVIAATQGIPDEDSSKFFGAVRERISKGASPGVAVRDERLEWLHKAEWVDGILVFE